MTTRGVSASKNQVVNSTDFDSIATAVTKMTAGGVVVIAPGVTPTLPTSFPLLLLDYSGPATPINVYQESGETTRFGKRVFRGQNAGSHNGEEYSLFVVEHHPVGSGTNGPTHADYSLSVVAQKKDFTSTSVVGEVDGILVVVRNGGTTSDSAGILANVVSYGTGFMAAFEATTAIISGVTTQQSIQTQVGVVDNVSPYYLGFYTRANTGTLHNAFRADTSATATWDYLFRGFQNGTEKFSISGLGLVGVGGATLSSSTFLNLPAGTTAISCMRLAHGSAPTSPVNGDMWTTTAGLFVRINGATVGPLS